MSSEASESSFMKPVRHQRTSDLVPVVDDGDLVDQSRHSTAVPDMAMLVSELATAPSSSMARIRSRVSHIQRLVGNQYVSTAMSHVQRLADGAEQGNDQGRAQLGPVEQQHALPAVEPIPVPAPASGPGDYNVPDQSDTAMAKHDMSSPSVQRDEDQSGPRADISAGGQGTITSPRKNPATGTAPASPAPFTITSSVVLAGVDVLTASRGPWRVDFLHEPSFQLQLDPASGLSAQATVALVNVHWMPPWRREIEASISPFIQTTLTPLALAQIGGQA